MSSEEQMDQVGKYSAKVVARNVEDVNSTTVENVEEFELLTAEVGFPTNGNTWFDS